MQTYNQRLRTALILSALLVGGCGEGPEPSAASAESEAPAISNRIDVPAEVVANLGITFRQAKRGRLETRMSIPGRLIAPPDRRWDVRTPFGGTVRIRKRLGEPVAKGDVVAELAGDGLRAMQKALWSELAAMQQHDLAAREAEIEYVAQQKLGEVTVASIAAARQREKLSMELLERASELVRTTSSRLEELKKLTASNLGRKELLLAEGAAVDAHAAALDARERSDTARTQVLRLEIEGANARMRASIATLSLQQLKERAVATKAAYASKLTLLAGLSGVPLATLTEKKDALHGWAHLASLPLAAPADGVVSEVTAADGEWVGSGAPLLSIVDLGELLFEGELPEIDAVRIKAGTPVRIAPLVSGIEPIDTTIGRVFPIASSTARTITIHARIKNQGSRLPAGVTATASVLLRVSQADEVLVPAGCIARDDLETVVFMQDRENPDKVIRLAVAIGGRSAEWVEVLTEVSPGDKLVEDGIHQLREAGSGKAPSGGHFHADGTWHTGDE